MEHDRQTLRANIYRVTRASAQVLNPTVAGFRFAQQHTEIQASIQSCSQSRKLAAVLRVGRHCRGPLYTLIPWLSWLIVFGSKSSCLIYCKGAAGKCQAFFSRAFVWCYLVPSGGQELRILPIPDALGLLIDIDGFLIPHRGRAVHRPARVDADADQEQRSAEDDLCVPSQRMTMRLVLLTPGQSGLDCQNPEQRKPRHQAGGKSWTEAMTRPPMRVAGNRDEMGNDDCQSKDRQSAGGQLGCIAHQQVDHENDHWNKNQQTARRADEIARERNPEQMKVQTAGQKIGRQRVAKVEPRIGDEGD